MIGISKLYCGTIQPSDPLRYKRSSKRLPSDLLQFSQDKKPVIVWNINNRCNLACGHCYASASPGVGNIELSTDENLSVIKNLAVFGVPVILFSGGEPLLRKDLFTLARFARKNGIRTVLSTNGTLINSDTAKEIKKAGVSYVGVSIDGTESTHDRWRRRRGAFASAIKGIDNCRSLGIKVGIRFTISKQNVGEIPYLFELAKEKSIERLCFYHLVGAGRAGNLKKQGLTHKQSREAVDLIIDLTKKNHNIGRGLEVLTVDNHADGPYLHLRLKREGRGQENPAYKLLQMNGGNNSAVGIGCINSDGNVYPDQFWRNHTLGNVKDRPFSDIWTDIENKFLVKLRDRKRYLKGRCSKCRWLDICNGNLRARAEIGTGDMWESDPGCYLSDDEIS